MRPAEGWEPELWEPEQVIASILAAQGDYCPLCGVDLEDEEAIARCPVCLTLNVLIIE